MFWTFWCWFWWSRLSIATGGLKVRVPYTARRRLIKVKLRTIFNKTLPHESLNNVTYDFPYLVMQWPASFCSANGTACNGSRFPTISLCTACDHRIVLRTDLKVLTAQIHPSEAQTISTLQY